MVRQRRACPGGGTGGREGAACNRGARQCPDGWARALGEDLGATLEEGAFGLHKIFSDIAMAIQRRMLLGRHGAAKAVRLITLTAPPHTRVLRWVVSGWVRAHACALGWLPRRLQRT